MTDIKIKVRYLKDSMIERTDYHNSIRDLKTAKELKDFAMDILRVKMIATAYDDAYIEITANAKVYLYWY